MPTHLFNGLYQHTFISERPRKLINMAIGKQMNIYASEHVSDKHPPLEEANFAL